MGRYRIKRWAIVLCVAAVVAAGCGSDDTDAGNADLPPSTSEAPPETTAPDLGSDETTTTTEPAPDLELTASYRGVTPTAIKVGILHFDLDAILELGVDVGYGDQQQHYQILIDELNENGGILGRQIEPVYRVASPVDLAAADRVCAEFIEDEEVFLVLGTSRPPTNVLCYTETSDTPFIGAPSGDLSDEVFERSTVPFIFPGRLPSRTDGAILAALELDDAIEGKVLAVSGASGDRVDSVAASLEALGAAKVVRTVDISSEADQTELASNLDVTIERYRAEGVDGMINLGDNVAVLAAFNRNAFAVPIWTTSPDVLADFVYDQGATDDELRLVRLILNETGSDLFQSGHEPTVECVDRWNELRPDEPALPDPGDDDLNNIGQIMLACHVMDIFVQAATAAGEELTVKSFTAGLDAIGSYETAGLRLGSLSSTKWDASDAAKLFRWSEEDGEIVAAEDLEVA
jgi:hypothetical protein